MNHFSATPSSPDEPVIQLVRDATRCTTSSHHPPRLTAVRHALTPCMAMSLVNDRLPTLVHYDGRVNHFPTSPCISSRAAGRNWNDYLWLVSETRLRNRNDTLQLHGQICANARDLASPVLLCIYIVKVSVCPRARISY